MGDEKRNGCHAAHNVSSLCLMAGTISVLKKSVIDWQFENYAKSDMELHVGWYNTMYLQGLTLSRNVSTSTIFRLNMICAQ